MNPQPLWAKRLARSLFVFSIFFILFMGLVILFQPPSRARDNALRSRCQSNLKQISLACLQYAQDYDESFPPVVNKTGYGWADLLVSYSKNWPLYQCPKGQDPSQINRIDYFYNSRLARKNLQYIEFPQQNILFGDSQDNSGTDTSLSELPRFWVTADNSPAKRHLECANYAFADGHVKFLRPEQISMMKPNAKEESRHTFAVR